MSVEKMTQANPGVEAALNELKSKVLESYPEAIFTVFEGEDPEGVYLEATVDVEDTDEVMDVVVDRLLTMQVEEGLPVYFLSARPLERELEALKERRSLKGVRVVEQNPRPLYR